MSQHVLFHFVGARLALSLCACLCVLCATLGAGRAYAAEDETLTWLGDGGAGTWEALGSQPVWKDANNASVVFTNGKSVIFDETANAGSITVSGTVAPGNMTISANNFFFEGGAITGSGTLTVSAGNNHISNALNFSGGYRILSGGNLAYHGTSLTGNIDLAGAVIFNPSDNMTYAGSLTGEGVMNKNADKKLTLTGDSPFSGVLYLNAGTLQVGADGETGSITNAMVFLANGATLAFNRSNSLTHSSEIAGTGNLYQNGRGALTLSGVSPAFTGNITINEGSGGLALTGRLGENGVYTGAIVNNSVLTLSTSNEQRLNGGIFGTGSLLKYGSQALFISGALAYSGNTTVENGTLNVSSSLGGGTYAGKVTVTSEGIVNFSSGDAQTLTRTVSNSGVFKKEGSSTLTLAGGLNTSLTSTQGAGTVQVLDGLLNIGGQGNYAHTVDVSSSGQLGLTVGNATALYADKLSLDPEATLNIYGTYADGQTLVSTNNPITGFDPQSVKAGGGLVVDYLRVSAELANGNKDIRITGELNWNMENSNRHGTFTLENASNYFTVGQNLADKSANPAKLWDGKTLTKKGLGTLVLTGANTYSGPTIIEAGTLQVGEGGTSGSITSAVQVAQNATLAFNRSDTIFYGGAVSGAGRLVKKGGGMLTLTGANSHTGGTVIEQGTLAVSTATLPYGRPVRVDSGASLSFTQGAAGAFTGLVSGQGRLVKNGAGTLMLTGANTYQGGTFVNAGTLEATTASLPAGRAVVVAQNSVLSFNQGFSAAFSGAVSGAGSLVKNGNGNLTLTGANTHQGGTFVHVGTLTASSASLPAGRGVTVAPYAALALNQSFSGAFSGGISGSGQLIKDGKGALTLSGYSPISGATTVRGGRLTLTGSLSQSPVTVAQYATFTVTGAGSLGKDLKVLNKGILEIGNRGTLNGKTTLEKGAVLQLTNQNKPTVAKKAFSVNKKAKVTMLSAKWKAGKTYTVLSAKKAADLKGFTTRKIAGNVYDATLRKGKGKKAKNLELVVKSTKKAAKYGRNQNASNALGALCDLSPSASLYKNLNAASSGSLASSGRQLSGQDMAALSGNLASLSRQYAPRSLSRLSGNTVALHPKFASFGLDADGMVMPSLAALPGTDSARSILSFNGLTLNAWTSHTGGDASLTSKGGAGETAIYGPESSGGYDLRFDNGYLLGASFRSGVKSMGERGSDSNASLDSYSFSLYGGREFTTGPGVLRLLAGASTSYHDIFSNRAVSLNGARQHLNADYSARSMQFFGELAYAMPLADTLIMEPFASVTLDSTRTDSFTESGGAAALSSAARTQQTTATLLGLRAHLPATERFAFTAELGWQRNHGDLAYSARYRFAEGGKDFTVNSNKLNRDAAAVGVGLDFAPTKSFKLNLGYNGQIGARSTDQTANLNLKWEF